MSRSETNTIIKSIKQTDYRNIEALSYSALSTYNKSPLDYYKKYVLKEKEKEDTSSLRLGQLLDIRVTDADNFDKYFIIATATTPAPQMQRFCQLLLECFNETDGIELGLKEAYRKLDEEKTGSKLQKTYEKMVESFNSEAKDYFKELLESKNRTLVTIEEASISEQLYQKWMGAKQFHCKGCQIVYKFPIVGKIMDYDFKCEVDKLVINNNTKTISIRDLKISSFIEDFFIQGFIRRNYYLQQGVYRFLVDQWKQNTEYKDYKIENFAFEVVDAQNKMEPLLYVCPDNYYDLSWSGFKVGNQYCKGIVQLIEELKRSEELNVWNISIKNYDNGGIVRFPELQSE